MDTIERQQIDDRVLDFFESLFTRIFSDRFETEIQQRRKSREVIRQIDAAADAASQSLSRFFASQGMELATVELILNQLANLAHRLKLEDVSLSNMPPETLVAELLPKLPPPPELVRETKDAEYRLVLHSVVQVLMLVGPVMTEWSKLAFATTFEVPKRVVSLLNQITEQLTAFGSVQRDQVDENYELYFRDYLMQRFHRVEVGTVKMTSNLAVDLRTLFVMPRVLLRDSSSGFPAKDAESEACELMNLSAARDLLKQHGPFHFGETQSDTDDNNKEEQSRSALDQVIGAERSVIIGLPGSGKSTFLEWLQLKIASAEETMIVDDRQAIPLLLRVRQLDAKNFPQGAELIVAATGSKDTAAVMPPAWMDRQMISGRVLLMLDGLDETSPELRDRQLFPWLKRLIESYPKCRYIVSSRPVGYPAGELRSLGFVEADLLDFNQTQVAESMSLVYRGKTGSGRI